LRWSPIAVELFMLYFLPRKAILNAAEIRSFPEVLRAWVRFALTNRRLEQRWIAEIVGSFIERRTRRAGDGSDHDPAWVVWTSEPALP
jgi:hypothetical protein